MDYAELQRRLDEAHVAWLRGHSAGNEAEANRGVEMNRQAVAEYRAAQAAPSPPPGPPPPPAPPPGPVLPRFTAMTTPDKNIKPAPSDIIQFDEDSIEIALLQDLLFEDIGGVELANISRTDLIDGQNVIYEPIKNLSSVRQEFNPNNVIATAIASNYFSRFGINLDSRGINEPYIDENGDLVVEVEDVRDGEEIQIQLLLNGTIDLVDE